MVDGTQINCDVDNILSWKFGTSVPHILEVFVLKKSLRSKRRFHHGLKILFTESRRFRSSFVNQ